MEIQKTQNSITYNEVASELFKLNLIVSYPYSDEILEGMAKTIIRLHPEVKIEHITELMDSYLIGQRVFEKENGLPKIISSLKSISIGYKHLQNNF